MTNTTKPTSTAPGATAFRRIVSCLVLCAACLFVPHSNIASAQDAFIEVEAPPVRYESAPRARYRGDPVYYNDGRWYARRGDRWGYYREEPRELVRYRHHRHHRHGEHVIVVRP
jgi:hypothetical protein